MMKNKVVLIFDAAQRSALASTRSLGSLTGVSVITCDCTPKALAGCSRFSDQYLQHPDPKSHPGDFIRWVIATIEEWKVDLLFPVTEISSRTLLKHRDELNSKLPFASLETVLKLSDKNALMQLAETLDVPIPATQYVNSSSEVDIQRIQFPCVVKPSLSRIFDGESWVETQVQFANNEEELNNILTTSTYLKHSPFMLQQFIEGHGAGIFTYYQNGQDIAFFAHQRIREKPPQGGVSVLSQSAPVDPLMRQHAKTLLDAVQWHGAAMVEFRIDNEGKPYLMEINARLWGSLQLAIDAGVNFPRLLLDGEFSPTVNAIESFNENVQLRWLLGDLDNLYLTLKSREYSIGYKLKHLVKFFIPRFSGRRHEVNRFGDFAPFWFELKHYFGFR